MNLYRFSEFRRVSLNTFVAFVRRWFPRFMFRQIEVRVRAMSYSNRAGPPFQVIVSEPVWSAALRPMTRNRQWIATGLVRRDLGRQPPALIIDTLATGPVPPKGLSLAPLADWIAIAMPEGDPPDDPLDWIQRLAPLRGQMLVILLIGLGREQREWRGWTVERGEVHPLSGFQVVGNGMIRVGGEPGDPSSELLGPSGRWSRTVHAVGEGAFAKLRAAKVAIVGVSRTGNLAAAMLAGLGVRRLGLIDGDALETHNLDSMILATEADLGKNKALAIARRLAAFRSDLAISVSPRRLGARFEEPAINDADLIVTCVDQDGPRLRVAKLASEQLVPHLDIGTAVRRGENGRLDVGADVRLLLPGRGCVHCVGGLRNLAEAAYELRSPSGALPRRPPARWDAGGRLGSLVTLNSMAVATGIQCWLDLLAGDLESSIWHRIQWISGESWHVDSGLVTGDRGCPTCRTASFSAGTSHI
jgi:molybdopterin/thiamine biosynthesis adenylyltransferase